MLVTNTFEAHGRDGFDPDRECPFEDVAFAEELVDDPWFAEVDAALDRGADVDLGVLEHLAGLSPDASLVARLAGVDRSAMSPEDAVTFTVVAERALAWLTSLQIDAILAAGSGHTQVQELLVLDPRPDRHGETRLRIADVIREEIAAATRWSLNQTHDRLVQARMLAAGLPKTHESQATGLIGPAHVQVLVQQAKRLPFAAEVLSGEATDVERASFVEGCEEFEQRTLPAAERGTVAQARTAARRAVLAIDGQGESRGRQQVRAIRDAFVWAEDDGLAVFAVRMATENAHACLAAVDALAHDDRFVSDCDATIGERRAEAATALILTPNTPVDLEVGAGIAGGDPRQPQGRQGVPEPRLRAHLDVTIDLATLLDLRAACDDAYSGGERGRDTGRNSTDPNDRTHHRVAEIAGAGAGPVSADVIRDLLADPDVAFTIRRLVTDPTTGHLLDYGRRTYHVSVRLREFLTARDHACRFPGCSRKASRCQQDHATAWDDGGQTNVGNLGALCVRHHQLKTHSGWAIVNSQPHGSCGWTSPQGREYAHAPKPLTARDIPAFST